MDEGSLLLYTGDSISDVMTGTMEAAPSPTSMFMPTRTIASEFSNYTNSSDFYDEECVLRESLQEHKDLFPFIIYGILLNSVGGMGLVGNILSVMILSRPNMRSSINCCFVGLSTFDSILLTTSILMFGLTAVTEYTGHLQWYQRDVFPWVTLVAYPLGIVAQTGSVYLTVTVTVERYVAVCHPLKARSLCTFGRAKIYVGAVALFSLLYNLPRFAEVTYKRCNVDGVEFTTVVMTDLRRSASYIQIYITWLYLVVMYLLPFISLLVFNAFIYKQVRLANLEMQHLSRLQKKELSLAVMLLVVVIVFFFCNVLAFIVSVLELFQIAINELTILNNFLVTVNSSVNFIIYCIFGQKFRRLFLQIFCFGALQKFCGPDARGTATGAGCATNNSMYRERISFSVGRSTQSIRLSSVNNGTYSSLLAKNNPGVDPVNQRGGCRPPVYMTGSRTSGVCLTKDGVASTNTAKIIIETVPEDDGQQVLLENP
uniref:FMRFamide receptor-like n=1 Tax=Hirondellea gigas TaxID=1518452 RepID=A0A6A7G2Q3_9CRUS